jgi:CBS domain-containing protein
MRTVSDVMHRGLISCRPDATLVAVARTMAAHRIHCVVVPGHGIITDAELTPALAGRLDLSAAATARQAPLVEETDTLERAAQVLREHSATHALVADALSKGVIGVLSTLDLADAFSR